MTFRALLKRLDTYCGGCILAGSEERTFQRLMADEHPDPYYAPLLRMLIDWVPIRHAAQSVYRADLVRALGPLRLSYQQADADPAGYRALNRLIAAIDAAYDDAALEARTLNHKSH
ncbi:MAG: hypothetical protein P8Y64_09595 [Gammaproteobacteria bacterium]